MNGYLFIDESGDFCDAAERIDNEGPSSAGEFGMVGGLLVLDPSGGTLVSEVHREVCDRWRVSEPLHAADFRPFREALKWQRKRTEGRYQIAWDKLREGWSQVSKDCKDEPRTWLQFVRRGIDDGLNTRCLAAGRPAIRVVLALCDLARHDAYERGLRSVLGLARRWQLQRGLSGIEVHLEEFAIGPNAQQQICKDVLGQTAQAFVERKTQSHAGVQLVDILLHWGWEGFIQHRAESCVLAEHVDGILIERDPFHRAFSAVCERTLLGPEQAP